MEKDSKNKSQHLGFMSSYTWPLSRCIRNLKTLALIETEKSVTENLIGEKENGQIMEMVSIRRLFLSYTMQQVIPNICTKFQNPRCSCFCEIFDTNFPMYYIGVRDGKNGKRRQKLISAS